MAIARITQSRVALFSACMTVLALVVACGSPAQPTAMPLAGESPTSAPTIAFTPTAQPQPSGTVTIALSADINGLDPHLTCTRGTDCSVLKHIYNSLITRGPDLELRPELAESWSATSDTTWLFNLRSDVVFPNGEKLDASVVKWNIERITDPELGSAYLGYFNPIIEVRIIDDFTVELVTSEPYPTLEDELTWLLMLPPEWASEHTPAQETMGTGPYTLKEWVKDDHVTLEARADYWGTPPAFKTVTYRAIPDASSRVAGLLAGEVDVVVAVSPDDFDRINSSGRAQASAIPSTRTAFLLINTSKEPMDDVRVRQALNYAVDKEALIEYLLQGLTAPSKAQITTAAYYGHDPDLEPYSYDPEKARELLAEAGLSDGFEMDMDVPTGKYLLAEQIAQAIASQLGEVGIRVNINEMAFSAYMNKVFKEKDAAQTGYLTYSVAALDATGLLVLFTSGNPYSYWDDEAFTELVNAARSTVDAAERLELERQAAALMREGAPIVFLFPEPYCYAVRNDTVDWQVRPDDWLLALDMQPK